MPRREFLTERTTWSDEMSKKTNSRTDCQNYRGGRLPGDTWHLPPRSEAARCRTDFSAGPERKTGRVGPAATSAGGTVSWPPAATGGGGTLPALPWLASYVLFACVHGCWLRTDLSCTCPCMHVWCVSVPNSRSFAVTVGPVSYACVFGVAR